MSIVRRLPSLSLLLLSGCGGPAAPTSSPVAPSAPVSSPITATPPVASETPATASASASAPVAPPPGDAKKPPFNVLMISIDSLRADMPWNGYPRDIAPHLTALEKRAVSYTNGYSISSFTSKSLGGFLGGRLPSELKRTGSFFTRYLDENVMFPEALHAQGIHTFAGHAHNYLGKGESGFEQGFERWQIVPGITFDYNTDPWITSQKLTPLAIEMLSDKKLTEGRFFAWFHYMDPHERYLPHPDIPKFGDPKKPKSRDLYDGEVFYTDEWIGKLMDFVEQQPWAKDTVVVFTADHGEAFGEHHLSRHAFELYEVLVHVPLFFLVPGQPARHVEAARSHIDLVPTIFELLGATPNPELRGKSFAGELLGGEADARDVLCDLPEDSHNERRRSLLHDGWKIIALANDFRFELYDLKNDPGEKTDLIKKDAEHAKDMIARYKAASATIKDEPVKGGVQKHKD